MFQRTKRLKLFKKSKTQNQLAELFDSLNSSRYIDFQIRSRRLPPLGARWYHCRIPGFVKQKPIHRPHTWNGSGVYFLAVCAAFPRRRFDPGL